MTTIHERLRIARENAGYETAADAARAFGWIIDTYNQHENGNRGVTRPRAIVYSRAFRVSIDWLYDDRPGGTRIAVPVTHYVGAGAEVYAINDYPPGEGLYKVDAPPGVTDCIAAKVRGDSMYPALQDGWLIFYRKQGDGVSEDCIGKLCVVCLVGDACYVKTIRRGSQPGTFTLESFNAPPIENAKVAWASRVLDIRPS